MSDLKYPCITYARSRPDDRRASELAGDRQHALRGQLRHSEGYEVIGGWNYDTEFADPFCGELELRPSWDFALDCAKEIAKKHETSTLVVLRSGGIGSGDPFLPPRELIDPDSNLHIRVGCFPLRSHAITTSLQDAWKRFDRYCDLERERHCRVPFIPIDEDREHGLIFRHDPVRKLVKLYFCNDSPRTAKRSWNQWIVHRGGKRNPRISPDWMDLEIPPGHAVYLDTIFQGEDWVSRRIKFRGNPRRLTETAILLTPADLNREPHSLHLNDMEMDGLYENDFKWQEMPHPQTRRLHIRNWLISPPCIDDLAAMLPDFAAEGAEKWLDHDRKWRTPSLFLRHLAMRGSHSPTYWVLCRYSDWESVGICGLRRITAQGSPLFGKLEIGWWLRPAFRGQGFAHEAASEVLRCALEEFGLDYNAKIYARIDRNDSRSRRLAVKLGMSMDDTISLGGDSDRAVLYSIDGFQHWYNGMTAHALD